MTVSGWSQTQGKYNIGEDEMIKSNSSGSYRPMNNDGISTVMRSNLRFGVIGNRRFLYAKNRRFLSTRKMKHFAVKHFAVEQFHIALKEVKDGEANIC